MGLHEILSLLRAEEEKIDRVIASLEELQVITSHVAGSRRGGRKSMNKEECREVSAQMKRFCGAKETGSPRPVAGTETPGTQLKVATPA